MAPTETSPRFYDRTGWASGPWDDEPDTVSWVSAVGLQCFMRRSLVGVWAGYAGMPSSYPVWKLENQECFDVHGGVTFCGELGEYEGSAPPPGLRWIGFDCAHAFDAMPAMRGNYTRGTYRDLDWVRAECESLAAQIDAIALLDEASFDVTAAPEWAIEYAHRFHVPRAERLALLRRLAADPVAAQLAESMGITG